MFRFRASGTECVAKAYGFTVKYGNKIQQTRTESSLQVHLMLDLILARFCYSLVSLHQMYTIPGGGPELAIIIAGGGTCQAG